MNDRTKQASADAVRLKNLVESFDKSSDNDDERVIEREHTTQSYYGDNRDVWDDSANHIDSKRLEQAVDDRNEFLKECDINDCLELDDGHGEESRDH